MTSFWANVINALVPVISSGSPHHWVASGRNFVQTRCRRIRQSSWHRACASLMLRCWLPRDRRCWIQCSGGVAQRVNTQCSINPASTMPNLPRFHEHIWTSRVSGYEVSVLHWIAGVCILVIKAQPFWRGIRRRIRHCSLKPSHHLCGHEGKRWALREQKPQASCSVPGAHVPAFPVRHDCFNDQSCTKKKKKKNLKIWLHDRNASTAVTATSQMCCCLWTTRIIWWNVPTFAVFPSFVQTNESRLE